MYTEEKFRILCKRKLNYIIEKKRKRDIAIYGAGKGGRILYDVLNGCNDCTVQCFVDRKHEEINIDFPIPVIGLKELDKENTYLIISLREYDEKVVRYIEENGVSADNFFYLANDPVSYAKRILKRKFMAIKNRVLYWDQWGEHRLSNGSEYPGKIFYIIRKRASDCGLMAFVITNIGFIDYAITHGYCPVIDMMNYPIDSLMEKEEIGKVNIWERYFEQPSGYSLEDIKYSKNIVQGKDYALFGQEVEFPMYDEFLFENVGNARDKWKKIVRQNIRVKPEIKEEIENYYSSLFVEDDRVLGVLYRGTDFLSNRPKGHYISPSFEQLYEKMQEMMRQYKLNKIYLATEDKRCRDFLDTKFPKMVFSIQNDYINYVEHSCINDNIPKGKTKYESGKTYLMSIYCLSMTNCFLSCRCSAASYVACLDSKFEYEYYWDLGTY